MARLILLLLLCVIVGIIAIIIAVVKIAVGQVTGNKKLKNTSLKVETESGIIKVMDKTAKGIGWMKQQWEQSKKKAEDSNKKTIDDE
ncbi:MAG: hypothetical protein V1709_05015 [Planctomycetota bacterium]